MVELSDDIFRWIADNAKADTTKLRLKHHGNPEMEFAITQIECRRKAASKLADTLKSPRFLFPTLLSAEQSTSDTLAEFHASLIEPGSKMLDMTCGLGIDALHCSRKAASVTAIEIQPLLAEAATFNAEALGAENITVVCADSTEWIKSCGERFDTVFIDPARRGEHGERLYALSQCTPDVVTLLPELEKITRRVIIKASPMLDVSRTIAELHCVEAIYLIGTPTECKELTAVIDFTLPADSTPTIHAVTPPYPSLTFTQAEEAAAVATPALPSPGMFLYEPFPAVLKSGGFGVFAERFNLSPLHRHTHLYISDRPQDNVPARTYGITAVVPFSRQGLRQLPTLKQANVSVRNFIIPASELTKKLKLRPGGNTHIFGIKDATDAHCLLITTPYNQSVGVRNTETVKN